MSKCLECGYYDKEKHYCPFYCQLIRETLDEAISFELEKMKEEIKFKCRLTGTLEEALQIIDNCIKELKGENNDSKSQFKRE